MADQPCDEWTTAAAIRAACPEVRDQARYPDETLARWLTFASAWLYRRTARRFRGLCVATVHPVGYCTGRYSQSRYGDPGGAFWYDSRGGRYGWGHYVGRAEGALEVRLGYEPLRSIVDVTSDGQTLTSTAYRVDDRAYLVRTDGESWPGSNDFTVADGQPGTWPVTLRYGEAPPADGALAAAVLTAELVLAAAGQECRLPKRVQSVSRQGVTAVILDPLELIGQGRTGIPEVDLFVGSVNPSGLARPSGSYSPDGGRAVRRVGTGS